jgi:hypothetical protein
MEMADYLMPNEEGLSVEIKRKIFEIRNTMVDIPANFSSRTIFVKSIVMEINNNNLGQSCAKPRLSWALLC